MDALGDRLRDAERPVDATPWTMVMEDDNVRFVQEETTDEVPAHAPERGEIIDRVVPLEGGLRCQHADCLRTGIGKTRDTTRC